MGTQSKILLFIIFLLCQTSLTFAATEERTTERKTEKMGLSFTPGAHIGPSFADARVRNQTTKLNTTTSTNLGILIGASGEIDFNHDFLFFQIEANYVEKGAEYATLFNATTTTFRHNYNYLNFPLLMKAKMDTGDFKPFFILGPEFSFLLSATYEESRSNYKKVLDIRNQTSASEFGLLTGIGAEIAVTKSFNATAQIRYSHGFTNINELVSPLNYEWRNFGWQFLLGMGFPL